MTQEQKDRLSWIEHVLSDGDAGRFYSWEQLEAMDKERKELRELAAKEAEKGK